MATTLSPLSKQENMQETIQAFSTLIQATPNFFSSIRSIYFEQCACHLALNNEFSDYLFNKIVKKTKEQTPPSPRKELAYFLVCVQNLTSSELVEFLKNEILGKQLLFQTTLPKNQFKLYTFLFSLLIKFGSILELSELLSQWYCWFVANKNDQQNYLIKLSKRAPHISFIVLLPSPEHSKEKPVVCVLEDSFFPVGNKQVFLTKRKLFNYSVSEFHKYGHQLITDPSSFWTSNDHYPFPTFETIFPLSFNQFLTISQQRASVQATQYFIQAFLSQSTDYTLPLRVKELLIRNHLVDLMDCGLMNGVPTIHKVVSSPCWQNLYDYVHYCKIECLDYCKLNKVLFYVKDNDRSTYLFQLIRQIKDPFLTFWYFSLPSNQRFPHLFDRGIPHLIMPLPHVVHSKIKLTKFESELQSSNKTEFQKVLKTAIVLNKIKDFVICFPIPKTAPAFVSTLKWVHWVDLHCTNSQKIKLMSEGLYISESQIKKKNDRSLNLLSLQLYSKTIKKADHPPPPPSLLPSTFMKAFTELSIKKQ